MSTCLRADIVLTAPRAPFAARPFRVRPFLAGPYARPYVAPRATPRGDVPDPASLSRNKYGEKRRLTQPERVKLLRELLRSGSILAGPCCHDAISARLIERAGFDFAFMSGFCTAGAKLGAPDTGLIS